MKIRYITILFCVSIILLTNSSCFKENLGTCTGNCYDFKVSGTFYDAAYNKPISNCTVEDELLQNGYCILCTFYGMASGKSGNDGKFSLHTDFDTTKLRKYHVTVNASGPSNYLSNPEIIDPGQPELGNAQDEVELYNIADTSYLQNLVFKYYPATKLTLHFHRTTPIANDPDLLVEYTFDNRSAVGGFYQSENNKDTTLDIYTSANMFTKIATTKSTNAAGNQYSRTLDSVKCQPNVKNSIDIYY